MKNLKRIVVIVAILGLFVCAYLSYGVYKIVLAPNVREGLEQTYVYIPTGTELPELLPLLEPVLKDTGTFSMLAVRKQYDTHIKPGRYLLKPGMSNNDIINVLRSQNMPIRLAFNNQETLGDFAGRIGREIEADSSEILEAFTNPVFLNELGMERRNVLSIVIPNTYEVYWNTDAESFRDRMLSEYKRFWNEERVRRASARNLSPMEVYVLASVVQKETARPDERPRVAGVYLNRLRLGMRLQADPTVIFAIKESTGNYDTIIRRVLNRDLELDSPYNTYKYAGLPPGPIAMPDISSIEAVLNPEEHQYLYFVADPERPGYHLFGRNLSEHNRNKSKYIQWLDVQNIRR